MIIGGGKEQRDRWTRGRVGKMKEQGGWLNGTNMNKKESVYNAIQNSASSLTIVRILYYA